MSIQDSKAATEQNDEYPEATVNTTPDGNTPGVVLFLGKSELEGLGVTDAESVQYQVKNGHLKLREVTVE
ncbi:hypothetical protein [Halobellus sp. EA9]|uniref:hypothetical protein n=1 Tax=Halobellus sp. EA9 TaxID=3421647 RepID=UPI003EB76C14